MEVVVATVEVATVPAERDRAAAVAMAPASWEMVVVAKTAPVAVEGVE